jgi:hypothetical protein
VDLLGTSPVRSPQEFTLCSNRWHHTLVERVNDPLGTLGAQKEATVMSEPRVVGPGQGTAYVLMESVHITFKRRGVPGEGCSIFEDACQTGYQGHPPHLHRYQDEDFYVLEEHFEFLVDDRTVECGPGSRSSCTCRRAPRPHLQEHRL